MKFRKLNTLKMTARTMVLASALIAIPVAGRLVMQPAFAQASGDYGKTAGKIADVAMAGAKSLNLTDAQKSQLKAIGQKYAPQIRAIATNSSLSSEEKKTQLAALRVSVKAEVDAVLTPKQKAQLAALRASVQKQVAALIAKIADELDLTEQQTASIKSILMDARLAGAAIVTDPSASRADKRSSLSALRIKTRGEAMAVLTPEQQSQLEAILNQIRPALMQRAASWRSSGGLGLGLMP